MGVISITNTVRDEYGQVLAENTTYAERQPPSWAIPEAEAKLVATYIDNVSVYTGDASDSPAITENTTEPVAEAPVAPKKRMGRPPKSAAAPVVAEEKQEAASAPKKIGRPKKAAALPTAPVAKKIGRPKKAV